VDSQLSGEAVNQKKDLAACLAALADPVHVVIGKISDQRVAIPVEIVTEVLPRVYLNTIPESPQYVAGYLQWRGIAVPVIDPAARWGDPQLPIRLEDRILILSLPEGPRGLLMTDVEELEAIGKAELTSISLEIPAATYAIAAWHTGENTVLLLDAESLIESAQLQKYAIR
jgi:purine-binding chemotaxis protein CheW